jgi:hypothetical protein
VERTWISRPKFFSFAPTCVTLTLSQQGLGDAEGGHAGKLEGLRDLSVHEDRALRDVFGRWPEPWARAAGAAVVQAYQRVGTGHWFLCDCVTSARPPALVPVSESYIRRHHGRPGRSTIRIATSFGTTSSSERSFGLSPGGSVMGRFPF